MFTLKVDGIQVFSTPSFPPGWNFESVDVPYGQHIFQWCFTQSDDALFYIDDITFDLSPWQE